MPSYTFIQKRGYVEFYIDGKFAGNFDSKEEAMEEVTSAQRGGNDDLTTKDV